MSDVPLSFPVSSRSVSGTTGTSRSGLSVRRRRSWLVAFLARTPSRWSLISVRQELAARRAEGEALLAGAVQHWAHAASAALSPYEDDLVGQELTDDLHRPSEQPSAWRTSSPSATSSPRSPRSSPDRLANHWERVPVLGPGRAAGSP